MSKNSETGKKRVMDLARELKISSSALMQILKQVGIPVKSHMNYIDKKTVAKIQEMFASQMKAAKKRQKERKDYQKEQRKKRLEKKRKEIEEEKKKKEPAVEKEKISKTKTLPKEKQKKKTEKAVEKKRKFAEEKKVKEKPEKVLSWEKQKTQFKDRKQKEQEEQRKKFFDQQKIKGKIKATLSKSKKRKKYKKDRDKDEKETQKIIIKEFTSVAELAKIMNKTPTEIVAKFMELGKMVTINQRLDKESLIMICDEFNFEVDFADQYGTDIISSAKIKTKKEDLKERPPVVVVMGHVDHGKTSILDYIRESNIIAGEAGKITQHIGAYQVEYKNKKITFIDTPGHKAFTAMRARGADITDIAVIVIAADDGVMPQTIEAIDHAKAADIPMIVAINKIDLSTADAEKVKAELSQENVRLQGWGGDIEYVESSAKTGKGINELLETILLVGEVEELKARYSGKAEGTVVEAKLDKGKGPIATILVRNGLLKTKNIIICGAQYGKIRLMLDERQNIVEDCYPSGVVQILGLNGLPLAGDNFNVVEDEETAKNISEKRKFDIRQRQIASGKNVTLDNIFEKIKESKITELNVIVKADTDGSVEAICDSLQKIESKEVGINIIHKGVGGIVEADVDLAAASKAIIVGFHVRPNAEARKAAEIEKVEIRLYEIIFEAIDDIKKSLEGLLKPIIKEKIIGTVEVKQTFKISKIGTIAGCKVKKGKVKNNSMIKIYRDDIKIYEGKINTLKRFENEVQEVIEGQECGISIENYDNIKEGDIFEVYIKVEKKRKLQ